jgi:hypothetical protein
MSSVGGTVFEGNSKLFAGPLGVVQIGFKGYDLGKTTADTNLVPDQDVKDINYQQDGTKAADHVRTGIDYILNATFGEIKTGLIDLLMAGISTQNTSALDDDGTIDRVIYESMRETEGGGLKVAAVNADGIPSANLQDILNVYEAIPIVNGDLVNWGADTQRNFPVQFRIKRHKFDTGESTTKTGAFGYWGDPTSEDVPAIVFPDVEAPILLTAVADTATTLVLTFNENIAFKTTFTIGKYIAKINEVYTAPLSGVIALKALTITFAAATFTSGDLIEISVGGSELQDTESTPNVYAGIDAFTVTNSVP